MFSSRMMLFAGELQKLHRVLALYRREILQELLERSTPGNIVQQGLRGNARPHKHERPSQNLRVRMNGAVIEDSHGFHLAHHMT